MLTLSARWAFVIVTLLAAPGFAANAKDGATIPDISGGRDGGQVDRRHTKPDRPLNMGLAIGSSTEISAGRPTPDIRNPQAPPQPWTALSILATSSIQQSYGAFPLRFNGANKIVRHHAYYYALSATERGGGVDNDFLARIYRRPVDQAGRSWTLVATLPDAPSALPCQFGPGETISIACRLERLFTFTGTIVADPLGHLHVFEFAAVSVDAVNATTRLVHFKTQAPVTGNESALTWNAFVQPPSIHSAYSIGVVTATYDARRDLFHVVYAGGSDSYVPPNYDALFVAKSGGAITKDPYVDGYKTMVVQHAFLYPGADFLRDPTVIYDSEPVFYRSSEELMPPPEFVVCSGREVSLRRTRKYPFVAVRGDELVIAAVVNTEGCRQLTAGAAVCCPERSVSGRVVPAHVNFGYDRYDIQDSGGVYRLVHRDRGWARPPHRQRGTETVAGEMLTCARSDDLFDVAADASGNLFFASMSSTEAIDPTCTRTRRRQISVLTAADQFLRNNLEIDWSAQNGLPCLAQTSTGLYWFITGYAERTLLGQYWRLSFDGARVTRTAPSNSVITLPPLLNYSYFPQCLNDRVHPHSSDRLVVLTTVADEELGQVADPGGRNGSTIVVAESFGVSRTTPGRVRRTTDVFRPPRYTDHDRPDRRTLPPGLVRHSPASRQPRLSR